MMEAKQMERELLKLRGDVVTLREIVKQIGWMEVRKIRKLARGQEDTRIREDLTNSAERLTLFLGRFDK